MTDPLVEFPHPHYGPQAFSPRYYHRDGTPATAEELEAAWADRGVAWTLVRTKGGSSAVVSTIFLALDHAFPPEAGPILFETAVFDGAGLVFRVRSRSEAAARSSHASAVIDLVAAIENSTDDDPFPTATVETTPSGYLPAVPLEEGTPHDRDDVDG